MRRVRLSHRQLEELIDREATERLDMSGAQFVKQYRAGTIEDSPAVRDVGMLVRLAKEAGDIKVPGEVRRLSEPNTKRLSHRHSSIVVGRHSLRKSNGRSVSRRAHRSIRLRRQGRS